LPDNGQILHRKKEHKYIKEIKNHSPVDLVVIDGKYRESCVDYAIDALSDDGVIVFDDYDFVMENKYGFKNSDFSALIGEDSSFATVPFYGPKALSTTKRCTAICHRPENVLGL